MEENYVYVDKTEYIYKLLNEGNYYFMSRPRRFGKSLLISTMEEVLKGNRNLFESCFIYASNYNWQKYPVIHFDFTQIPTESTADLEKGLHETMDNIAASYELSLKGTSLMKNYAEKYLMSGKTLAVVGVNFDSKTRNISDWKGRVIKPSGELIKELHSLYHIHAKR